MTRDEPLSSSELMGQSALCLMTHYLLRPCPLMAAAIARHLRWLAEREGADSAASRRLYATLAAHWGVLSRRAAGPPLPASQPVSAPAVRPVPDARWPAPASGRRP